MICAPSGSADPLSLLSGVHKLCVLLVLVATEDSVVVGIFNGANSFYNYIVQNVSGADLHKVVPI